MNEKEKMLAGELYDANYNEDLIKERIKAKDLCFEYNHTLPSKMETRNEILRQLLGSKLKILILLFNTFISDFNEEFINN